MKANFADGLTKDCSVISLKFVQTKAFKFFRTRINEGYYHADSEGLKKVQKIANIKVLSAKSSP